MAAFGHEAYTGTLLAALNPIRDISKNWGIDLAQHLEQYLGQIAIEHGTNFTEAAMLIENSASIYDKKVDYVWNLSQILLENMRKGKFSSDKKKKKSSEEDGVEGTTDSSGEPTKNKKNKHIELNKSKYGEINIEISEKLLELEPTKDKPSKASKALHDLCPHFLKRPPSNKRTYTYQTAVQEESQEERRYTSNTFLLGNLVLHHEFQEDGAGFCLAGPSTPSVFNTPSIHQPSFLGDDIHMDDVNDESGVDPLPPFDVLNPDPSGPNTAQDTDEKKSSERAKSKKPVEVLQEVPTPEAIANAWDPIPLSEDLDERPISKKKKTKLPCDPNLLTLDALGCFKRKHGEEDTPLPQKMRTAVLQYIADTISNKFTVIPEFYHLQCLQSKRMKKKELKRRRFEEIRPTLLKDFDAFEDFRGFEDYEPSASEKNELNGGFPCPPSRVRVSLFQDASDVAATSFLSGFRGFDDNAVDESDKDDEEDQDCVAADDVPLTDAFPSPPGTPLPSLPYEHALHESGGSPLRLEMEQMAVEAALPKQTATQALESQMALAQRVAEWHESMRPMLAIAQRRGHFDIHEYGTRILESFPRNGGRNTMTLQQLVREVETRDVARYFLASLQLANTYNIEINTPQEALTMDRMDLTLLSVQRHHQQLEDFVAPSQEDAAGTVRVISNSVHRVHQSATKQLKAAGTKRKH